MKEFLTPLIFACMAIICSTAFAGTPPKLTYNIFNPIASSESIQTNQFCDPLTGQCSLPPTINRSTYQVPITNANIFSPADESPFVQSFNVPMPTPTFVSSSRGSTMTRAVRTFTAPFTYTMPPTYTYETYSPPTFNYSTPTTIMSTIQCNQNAMENLRTSFRRAWATRPGIFRWRHRIQSRCNSGC